MGVMSDKQKVAKLPHCTVWQILSTGKAISGQLAVNEQSIRRHTGTGPIDTNNSILISDKPFHPGLHAHHSLQGEEPYSRCSTQQYSIHAKMINFPLIKSVVHSSFIKNKLIFGYHSINLGFS